MAAGRRPAPYAAAAMVAALTVAAFLPLLDFPFLNWDDQDVFVRNDALRTGGTVGWAFTTRFMEHYQPLAWLTWAGVERGLGLTPAAAHGLNVVLHALCGALVCVLISRVARETSSPPPATFTVAIALAALFWSLHPLRVEAVAWASAMPYALSLTFALLAVLAWLDDRVWTAAILTALSLFSRPLALALPVVLFVIRRPATTRGRVALGLAGAAALAAAAAESSARLTATLTEFGPGARLTLAASAPWRYLWRTIWPARLTPLDPLALAPRTDALTIALGGAAVALVSAAAWRSRKASPAIAGAWASYLLLLVPAMGLVPSGLQATADRYAYMPGVALSVALAAFMTRLGRVGRVGLPAEARANAPRAKVGQVGPVGLLAVVGAAVATLALLTWGQSRFWRDSTTLWARAVEIDARNDVALYNLGAALAEAGRRDEAIARYDEVLALVPANEAARRNRDLLEAARLEEEGNRLAASRDLANAIVRYTDAVRLDPKRTHSQAALGMALVETGRPADARPHLQAALDQGVVDPAIPNALAFALAQSGEEEKAIAILRAARQRYPDDPDLARNLEQMTRR